MNLDAVWLRSSVPYYYQVVKLQLGWSGTRLNTQGLLGSLGKIIDPRSTYPTANPPHVSRLSYHRHRVLHEIVRLYSRVTHLRQVPTLPRLTAAVDLRVDIPGVKERSAERSLRKVEATFWVGEVSRGRKRCDAT